MTCEGKFVVGKIRLYPVSDAQRIKHRLTTTDRPPKSSQLHHDTSFSSFTQFSVQLSWKSTAGKEARGFKFVVTI